jgi:hypothetical protein
MALGPSPAVVAATNESHDAADFRTVDFRVGVAVV